MNNLPGYVCLPQHMTVWGGKEETEGKDQEGEMANTMPNHSAACRRHCDFEQHIPSFCSAPDIMAGTCAWCLKVSSVHIIIFSSSVCCLGCAVHSPVFSLVECVCSHMVYVPFLIVVSAPAIFSPCVLAVTVCLVGFLVVYRIVFCMCAHLLCDRYCFVCIAAVRINCVYVQHQRV